jgi:hypothetical protein
LQQHIDSEYLTSVKLRIDLVKKLTPEMLMKSVLMNNHRHKAEPLFSKTGVGSLATATAEDRANEDKLSEEIRRELLKEPAPAVKKHRTKR